MAGLGIIIPRSGGPGPVLEADSMLTAGSLMLVDPAHSALPWSSGVPADGTKIPNIALARAKAIIPSATDDELRLNARVHPQFNATSTTTGKLERSGKGGLHGISPQGGNAVAFTGASLHFSTKLLAYILANPRHNYFASVWARPTRLPSQNGVTGFWNLGGNGQQTNGTLFACSPNMAGTQWGTRPNLAPPKLGERYPTNSVLQTERWNAATQDFYNSSPNTYPSSLPGDGTNDSIMGLFFGGAISFGPVAGVPGINPAGTVNNTVTVSPFGASANKDRAPSMIFYRLYLEDLTVSGRTYSTVDALDGAAYAAAFGTGGRYNGDTFTDPATIA